MTVKTQCKVHQIKDKDGQLFLNLEHGWGKVLVHSHPHDCVAAVLQNGGNVSFGMFSDRRKLGAYADLTGKAIVWTSEEES